MGTITVLPVLRLMMRSIRICLPKMVMWVPLFGCGVSGSRQKIIPHLACLRYFLTATLKSKKKPWAFYSAPGFRFVSFSIRLRQRTSGQTGIIKKIPEILKKSACEEMCHLFVPKS
jgi:hypothetical protein